MPGENPDCYKCAKQYPEANGNKDRKFSLGAQKMIDHNDKK